MCRFGRIAFSVLRLSRRRWPLAVEDGSEPSFHHRRIQLCANVLKQQALSETVETLYACENCDDLGRLSLQTIAEAMYHVIDRFLMSDVAEEGLIWTPKCGNHAGFMALPNTIPRWQSPPTLTPSLGVLTFTYSSPRKGKISKKCGRKLVITVFLTLANQSW